MGYKFKIQWVFEVMGDNKRNVLKIIDILGARSLDKINFRDNDFKIIDSYHGFIMYDWGRAKIETKKYIKKVLKENKNIRFIELVRR